MDHEKGLELIKKVIDENNKIDIDTELDIWYGQTVDGTKTAITELSLMEIANLVFRDKVLLEKIETMDFVQMPDGTKFGKTIRAIRENGMVQLAAELCAFAKQQNLKNGFLDASPEVG